jgi:hypothetical protein
MKRKEQTFPHQSSGFSESSRRIRQSRKGIGALPGSLCVRKNEQPVFYLFFHSCVSNNAADVEGREKLVDLFIVEMLIVEISSCGSAIRT